LSTNPAIKSPKLNKPPKAAKSGYPLAAPSMLHLIHIEIGGCQRTSEIVRALGEFNKASTVLYYKRFIQF
jgi:hypothetical protein